MFSKKNLTSVNFQADVSKLVRGLDSQVSGFSSGKSDSRSDLALYQELDDFILLMRSLSISYEQDRTAFSSEYKVKYLGPTIPIGTFGIFRSGGLLMRGLYVKRDFRNDLRVGGR